MNKLIFPLIALATLSSCASTSLNPGAERVLVTRQPPPAKNCRYLGTIIGEQGGSFTGGWTSNNHLAEGAMNDMKNKAYAMGANYVLIEDTRAGSTSSGSLFSSHGSQTDVTNTLS